MQEDIPLSQASAGFTQRKLLEKAELMGADHHSLYVCKAKRGMKQDDSKETYKLPHRLIEKKRRDRINECITQLKDLLPEHVKLTTLGHLEKAVVLELTLKHLKALTALSEQQHQKILALQNGDYLAKGPLRTELDAFSSGFETCASQVLQHLGGSESRGPSEQRCSQLIGHLRRAAAQLRAGGEPVRGGRGAERRGGLNCVAVIQRAQVAEHHGSDTDTDSGYGGESERKSEGDLSPGSRRRSLTCKVKQEPNDPAAKRVKMDPAAPLTSPEAACDPALHPTVGIGAVPALGQQHPFCLPFYLLAPSPAAPYMPTLGRANPEKCWYPAPVPLLYPGIPALRGISALAPHRLLRQNPSPGSGPPPGPHSPASDPAGSLRAERAWSPAPDTPQSPSNPPSKSLHVPSHPSSNLTFPRYLC